ncbi:MAG: hypothetical protein V1924_01315 [Candidatus Bathyarchaeota archaeon]
MNPLAQLRNECEKLLREALEAAYPGAELPEAKFSEPPAQRWGPYRPRSASSWRGS